MPKILLTLPPSEEHYVVPPIGLGYLASALVKVGFTDVNILDGQKENLTSSKFKDYLLTNNPSVIGIQIFSSAYDLAKKMINIARNALPKSIILIGGPHVTATADYVLKDFDAADYAFCGEAEPGMPLLISKIFDNNQIDKHKIPGLIFRDGDNVIQNKREIVMDLNSLGNPLWKIMPPNTYPPSPQGAFYKRYPIAPILTTRGCPYECTFCGSPVNMTRNYRVRDINLVFDEIEYLKSEYGVQEIHIIDDMFSLKKDRVLQFCNGLIERKIDISYTFPNGLRLDSLDKEILTKMKETGAYAFTVGIESGSDRILKMMKKQITKDLIREKVKLISECGIEPNGFFIIGFPGETLNDIKETISFAKSLPLKRAHFSNFLPLPGTELTKKLYDSGEVKSSNWSELTYFKVPYVPKGITKKQLKKLQRKAFLDFHLRPRILLGILKEIKSLKHLKSIIIRSFNYLFGRSKKQSF